MSIENDKHEIFLKGEYNYKIGTLVKANDEDGVYFGIIIGYDEEFDPIVYYFADRYVYAEYRRHISFVCSAGGP